MSTLSYTLFENDESRYVGPHRWQVSPPARLVRRALRYHAYTRWINQAFTEVAVAGSEQLDTLPGPAIFVGNHQSHLDTLLVHAAMPENIRSNLYFGAAQDRWFVRGRRNKDNRRKLELMPWYQSLALGNFPIIRGGGSKALSHARWLLERGANVFLFPEGTRNAGERIGEFKHGATLLARDTGAPIVPLVLSGLSAIRPKGSTAVTPGTAQVTVLEPVKLLSDRPTSWQTAELQESMVNALNAVDPLVVEGVA